MSHSTCPSCGSLVKMKITLTIVYTGYQEFEIIHLKEETTIHDIFWDKGMFYGNYECEEDDGFIKPNMVYKVYDRQDRSLYCVVLC